MKKIVFIHSDNLFSIPPFYSSLLILNDLGWEVSLITKGINNYWIDELSRRKISYKIISTAITRNKILNKIFERIYLRKLIERKLKDLGEYDYFWIEGKKIFDYVGPKFFEDKKFIIQVAELYEKLPRFQKKLKWFFDNAEISFVPEFTRANLFRLWLDLKELPTILPNCPYKGFKIENNLEVIKTKFPVLYQLVQQQKKIILYQGGIGKERDISNIIRYIDTIDEKYVVVIMGPPSGVDEVKSLSPKVYYLGMITAPEHLIVTSFAYIGILGYKPILLNNLFCAPNKIFEYARFSIPMIGNDIPGLYYPLKLYKAGLTCDTNSIQSIKIVFNEIINNYNEFAQGANNLYNDVDNFSIIKNSLARL